MLDLRVPHWGYGHFCSSSFFIKYFCNYRYGDSLVMFQVRAHSHRFLMAPVRVRESRDGFLIGRFVFFSHPMFWFAPMSTRPNEVSWFCLTNVFLWCEVRFLWLQFQGLGKYKTIYVFATQNVFGNNNRKKLAHWFLCCFCIGGFVMLPRLLLWLFKCIQTCSRQY